VVVIEDLTRLGKQRLGMFPDPLSPITDDAQAHLLFRNQVGLFDLLEGLAELLLVLHLMPTEHMDDALTIKEVEAKPLRATPLATPPRPPRSLASTSVPGGAVTVGMGRHIRAINAQDHHWPAKTARRHLSNAPLDLRT